MILPSMLTTSIETHWYVNQVHPPRGTRYPESTDGSTTKDGALESLSNYFISASQITFRETTLGVGGFGTVKLANFWSTDWLWFRRTATLVAVKFPHTDKSGLPLRTAIVNSGVLAVYRDSLTIDSPHFRSENCKGDESLGFLQACKCTLVHGIPSQCKL